MTAAQPPTYGISDGGALRALERRLGIASGTRRDWRRRVLVLGILTYGPILVVGGGWRLFEGVWLPTLELVSTHVRVLVTIPLLVIAEYHVDARAHRACRYLLDGGLIRTEAARDRYAREIARTASLRDSWRVELLILAGTIASTAAAHPPTPHAWITFPSLVALRFLIARWVWRWLLWALFLSRLARLPLTLRATHPDRLAGLGPLIGPSYGFAGVAAACSATLSGVWADDILYGNVHVQDLVGLAITFIVVAGAVALLPLWSFVPALYLARWGGLEHYGALAQRFAYAFEERWYGRRGKDALGDDDFSSLADMGMSFAVVAEIRLFPWTTRFVKQFIIWQLVPMAPLVMLDLGLHEVVVRLGHTLF